MGDQKNVKKTDVRMPLMGEGIQEATFVKWLKNKADFVEEGEALFEVSTDKVDTEIGAPASGYLIETFAETNQTLPIHAVLAFLADDKAARFDPPKKMGTSSVAKAETAEPARARTDGNSSMSLSSPDHAQESLSSQSLATPLAKRLARLTHVNVKSLRGSGSRGRVTKSDVLNFIEGRDTFHKDSDGLGDGLETQMVLGKEFVEGVEVRREKMSPIRKLTARYMLQSMRTSPHVTTIVEADLQKLVEDRTARKDAFLKTHGSALTFTHYILSATLAAIREHPIVNCSVDRDSILWKDDINLGFAVAIPTGLVVPVIKKCQEMTLTEISLAASDLVERARAKKLQADEIRGGTFSITNPGGFGSILSMPIINQPQVAILSIGQIVRKPIVVDENDTVKVRPMMYVGLTFDHRVIDGEGGAKFLATLKKNLETLDFI